MKVVIIEVPNEVSDEDMGHLFEVATIVAKYAARNFPSNGVPRVRIGEIHTSQ